jgi:hypothetical protein
MAGLICVHPVPARAQERPVPDQTEPQGIVGEPVLLQRAVLFGDRHFASGELRNGWYVDANNMIPGAGWIAGGPGYRRWSNKDRLFLDASTAISWNRYKTAQARIELPKIARSRLAIGSQIRWQDFSRVDTFGEGPGSLEASRDEYRVRSTNLVGYATVRPVEWVGIGAQIGWLKPSVASRNGPQLATQPSFVHGEASITADTRDFPAHPTRGGLARVAAAQYSDRDAGTFSFRRYEAEAARFVPLADSRLVIAVHGWLVSSDASAGGVVPFYLQPSLGGHNTLRGYTDYRFHDRNLLVVNAEVRIAMTRHVDAAFLVDAGNVAGRVGDLNLDKKSYGAGLRLHSRRQTFARMDVARGGEGWRVVFRLTDPLSLSRLSRRTASVPFVP